MPQFRRKPVVVEAELFDPDDSDQHRRLELRHDPQADTYFVPTLEGDMRVSVGDWIVTGVLGERYPCKPKAFELTFEPARKRKTQARANP